MTYNEQMEKINEIAVWIQDHVEGGVCEDIFSIYERAMEEEVMSVEFFRANELAICYAADAVVFTCEGCGWTQPVEQMGKDYHCDQCDDEDDKDE